MLTTDGGQRQGRGTKGLGDSGTRLAPAAGRSNLNRPRNLEDERAERARRGEAGGHLSAPRCTGRLLGRLLLFPQVARRTRLLVSGAIEVPSGFQADALASTRKRPANRASGGKYGSAVWVTCYRPASCAAIAAALSARFRANTRFFAFIASSACWMNRLAVSYCIRASALSPR